jgi:hypothetical protein
MTMILLLQRASPPQSISLDFFTAAYQAIDD